MAESFGLSRRRAKELQLRGDYGYLSDANGLASTVGAVRAWHILQTSAPCAFLAFNKLEYTMGIETLTANVRSADLQFTVTETYVPSVRGLPWEAVFRLRKDRRVVAFRAWLEQRAAQDVNTEHVINDLWRAFGELTPSTRGEVLKALASNIPMPIPVNPASVAISTRSVVRAGRFNRRNKWLIFLHAQKKESDR